MFFGCNRFSGLSQCANPSFGGFKGNPSVIKISVKSTLRNWVKRIYVWMFGRPSLEDLNHAIWYLATSAKGYFGDTNPEINGEYDFLHSIKNNLNGICIDIGANVGRYSEWLLQNTSAKVIAFEPLPIAYESLLRLKAFHPNRFIPILAAVSSQDSKITLSSD